jgi:hypothetical protein
MKTDALERLLDEFAECIDQTDNQDLIDLLEEARDELNAIKEDRKPILVLEPKSLISLLTVLVGKEIKIGKEWKEIVNVQIVTRTGGKSAVEIHHHGVRSELGGEITIYFKTLFAWNENLEIREKQA